MCLKKEVGLKRLRAQSRSRSRSRSLSVSADDDEEESDSCDMAPTIDAIGELAGKSIFCRYCTL